MAMAALAKVLRGGRRFGSGASSHLLPGISRRAPLEGVAGTLLPSLGSAGGIGRRLLSEASPEAWLDTLKKKYYMTSGGHYEPYYSEIVALDITRRLDNLHHRCKVHNKRLRYAGALVGVVYLMLAYLTYQCYVNHKLLAELQADVKQKKSLLKELDVLL
ncbi:hypothetical protein U9M48_037063 [Paspalum notatum var. saurae]|uniref:Uncharacterized protein n=1 Tax=Paspalum notatum var. saurae TaxID=547442 RepID=A0AAQ3UFN5_PASNO